MRFIKNLIKKALITLDRDSNTAIQNQASYMENVIKYTTFYPYGFIGKAEKDSMVMLFSLNNDSANMMGIEYDNKLLLDKFTDVEKGEVGLYHPKQGSYIIFKNNGDINIEDKHGNTVDLTSSGIKATESSNGELNLSSGKVALGGTSAELLDLFDQTLTQLNTLLTAMQIETHTGNLGYPTLVPLNAASYAAVQSSLATIKSQLAAIKGSL